MVNKAASEMLGDHWRRLAVIVCIDVHDLELFLKSSVPSQGTS